MDEDELFHEQQQMEEDFLDWRTEAEQDIYY